MLLEEQHYFKTGKKEVRVLLDYKVIPQEKKYQVVTDVEWKKEEILVDGEKRQGNSPSIVMLLGNKSIRKKEAREDVAHAYVVDIGMKKYIDIKKETQLTYIRRR